MVSTVKLVFAREVSSLFVDFSLDGAEQTLEAAWIALFVCAPCMITHGIASMLQSYLRMAGYSTLPLVASLVSNCGVRVLWNLFIFPLPEFHSLLGFSLGNLISYIVNFLIVGIFFLFAQRRIKKRLLA